MEQREKVILAVSPGSVTAAGRWGLPLAHLAYRMGPGPHLFRANSPVPPRGGLMVIDDGGGAGEGEAEPFCGEVLRECALRKFTGVFCRFRGTAALRRLAGQLAELCRERGLTCYVSETCAADGAAVVVSTAISGGTLQGRLEEAQSRFGPQRLALWVERAAEDFPLPSPSGSGRALTREELAELRREKGGSPFFSPELCAHYFTYMDGPTGHFVLFDDAASLRRKLQLARRLGVTAAFLPYGQVEDCMEALVPGR